jgi:hypothetical protein
MATSCNSLANRLGNSRGSKMHANQQGHAEWRLYVSYTYPMHAWHNTEWAAEELSRSKMPKEAPHGKALWGGEVQ